MGLQDCKRDKIKREVVKRRVIEGGLGIFDFLDFSKKSSTLNPNFTHNWKSVSIKQLKFTHVIDISIENALARENY